MSRRIPPNPVSRQLFPASDDDESRNDNFTNNQREQSDRESEEMSKKYHYDWKNDRPLPGMGNFRWFCDDNGRLIGVRQDQETNDEADPPPNAVEINEHRNRNQEVENNENTIHKDSNESSNEMGEVKSIGDEIEPNDNVTSENTEHATFCAGNESTSHKNGTNNELEEITNNVSDENKGNDFCADDEITPVKDESPPLKKNKKETVKKDLTKNYM